MGEKREKGKQNGNVCVLMFVALNCSFAGRIFKKNLNFYGVSVVVVVVVAMGRRVCFAFNGILKVRI